MTRLIQLVYAAFAIALVVWASGCSPTLTAQSVAPPGRTALLDENHGHYDLDLSQGVAIAIACYYEGPCKNVVVSTEDASIADVKGASFGALQNQWTGGSYSNAGIVVIGKAPGKTRIKVKTKDGNKTINVVVLAPPVVGEPAKAVARP